MERKLEEERLLKYKGNIAGTEVFQTDLTDSLIQEQEEEERLQFKPTLDATKDIREQYNYKVRD